MLLANALVVVAGLVGVVGVLAVVGVVAAVTVVGPVRPLWFCSYCGRYGCRRCCGR